jgi:hypothetical protein
VTRAAVRGRGQVFYVLSSIWLHQFYYLFGFLFLVQLILLMTCAEITIVLCYFQVQPAPLPSPRALGVFDRPSPPFPPPLAGTSPQWWWPSGGREAGASLRVFGGYGAVQHVVLACVLEGAVAEGDADGQ